MTPKTIGKRKSSFFWRWLFVALVTFQVVVFISLFNIQPDHSSNGHVSPHRLQKSDSELGDLEKSGSFIVAKAVKLANQRTLVDNSLNFNIHAHDFHLDGGHDSTSVWESLSSIPDWMKEYFSWHAQQRAALTKHNWRDRKFFIMQCVRTDPHCGGASDRLKPLPFLLYLAYLHKRIFLIWWTRPCALEEFLVPNAMNWTVPDFLPVWDVKENGKLAVKTDGILAWVKTNLTMIRTRMQSYEGGQLVYENRTTSSYNQVYHDLFRLMFEPSPPIATILREEMGAVHLIPGEYSVAHYRAFYARASRKESAIIETAINAVNCASVLRPGGPVYFASDSTLALQKVREYAQQHMYPVVTIENQEPLHLDKAGNWSERNPSDFYSIFIDLYLMGMGRCLTFGQGGFGRFGLLLGYNSSCTMRHFYKTHLCHCNWTLPD